MNTSLPYAKYNTIIKNDYDNLQKNFLNKSLVSYLILSDPPNEIQTGSVYQVSVEGYNNLIECKILVYAIYYINYSKIYFSRM